MAAFMQVEPAGKFALRVSASCGCIAYFCNDSFCPDYQHQMGFRDKCEGNACRYSHGRAERLVEEKCEQ